MRQVNGKKELRKIVTNAQVKGRLRRRQKRKRRRRRRKKSRQLWLGWMDANGVNRNAYWHGRWRSVGGFSTRLKCLQITSVSLPSALFRLIRAAVELNHHGESLRWWLRCLRSSCSHIHDPPLLLFLTAFTVSASTTRASINFVQLWTYYPQKFSVICWWRFIANLLTFIKYLDDRGFSLM